MEECLQQHIGGFQDLYLTSDVLLNRLYHRIFQRKLAKIKFGFPFGIGTPHKRTLNEHTKEIEFIQKKTIFKTYQLI